jgi:hypothetical protein
MDCPAGVAQMVFDSAAQQGRLPPEVRQAASRGWRLFPVKAGDKKPPLLKDWPHKATCDLHQLEALGTQFPNSNWGLACGPESGIYVLDVDGEDGRATIAEWDRRSWKLPKTRTHKTPRGLHLLFRWPEEFHFTISAGKLGPGIDERGDRGYILYPPSLSQSGERYVCLDETVPLADIPDWLLELIAANHPQTRRSLAYKISILPEGRRNDGLTRLGGALRRRGATRDVLESQLLAENIRRCRPPLPDSEVIRIAASVARYAPGGPDPLETAWAAVLADQCSRGYSQFLALTIQLQLARPGLAIALPLERIGGLMHCDWTQVRRWRQRAVREGRLYPVERYVPHRRAAQYILRDSPPNGPVPLGPQVPLREPTSGLVGHSQVCPSGISVEYTETDYIEGWL